MSGGTIGSRLVQRLEGDRDLYVPVTGPDGEVEYMGECRAHNVRRHVSARQIDAWGEAEFERLTWGEWKGHLLCVVCNTMQSANGACLCPNSEEIPYAERLLEALGLQDRK